MIIGGRPFRGTQAGGATDLYDADPANANDRLKITVLGARLVPAAAAATAQLVDSDGTVLADLAAPANGPADEVTVPFIAVGKVRLGAITGAGSAVTIYVQ